MVSILVYNNFFPWSTQSIESCPAYISMQVCTDRYMEGEETEGII